MGLKRSLRLKDDGLLACWMFLTLDCYFLALLLCVVGDTPSDDPFCSLLVRLSI
jgi:hypothetical protein